MKNSILCLILYVIALLFNAIGLVRREFENRIGSLNLGGFRKN